MDGIVTYADKTPAVGNNVYIAPSGIVIGDVQLGDDVSVWFNAVVRGDINRIEIGRGTNIQDGAVLHVTRDRGCVVGELVTIGHNAVVHACEVGDGVLVGMGAVVLNGAKLGRGCVIGAGAVVTEGETVPPGAIMNGIPAKKVRVIHESPGRLAAEDYIQLAQRYQQPSQ